MGGERRLTFSSVIGFTNDMEHGRTQSTIKKFDACLNSDGS